MGDKSRRQDISHLISFFLRVSAKTKRKKKKETKKKKKKGEERRRRKGGKKKEKGDLGEVLGLVKVFCFS